jgi:hypothetical protein
MAVLQFDACTIATLGAKAHLNLNLQVWVILPIGIDIPREDETRGRFAGKNAAPLTYASIVALLIPGMMRALTIFLSREIRAKGFYRRDEKAWITVAVVESERQFVKVARRKLRYNLMEHAHDTALEQTPNILDTMV